MTKEPTHQEDKIITTLYTANNRVPIYLKQTLTELKGELLYNKNFKTSRSHFQ
jgi:hypothetical protein